MALLITARCLTCTGVIASATANAYLAPSVYLCAPLKVLDEVRPYLIADGGNVRVMGVDVDRRVVSRLSGLASSSPPESQVF